MTEHTTSNNTPSNEAILEELQRLADELSQSPSMNQFNEYADCDITANGVQYRFNSWNNAIEKAGLEPNTGKNLSGVSDTEILNELQRLGDKLGQSPTMDQFNEYADCDITANGVRHRFDGWNNALGNAGLEPNPTLRRRKKVSDAEILEEIQRLTDKLGQAPTVNQFDEYANCNITAQAVAARFDGWNNALQEAGLEPNTGKNLSGVSDTKILNELQRLADELSQSPTMNQFDEYASCDITAKGAAARFDGWNNAVKEAGLEPEFDRGSTKKDSDTEILNELQRLADKLNQSPTVKQFNEYANCNITAQGVQHRFDSWNNALQEAGLEPNAGKNTSKVSDTEILNELQRLADKLGQAPTISQFNERANCNITAGGVKNRFNTWKNALQEAGVEPNTEKNS